MAFEEVICGPFEIYTAPVGTPFPAVDAAPGPQWQRLGTNGTVNQAESGVRIIHGLQGETSQPAGKAQPSHAFFTAQSLSVRVEMLDMSLEQYSHAMGRNPIARTTAAAGITGTRTMGLGVAIRQTQTRALLVRGASPYDNNLAAQYEIPRAQDMGQPDIVLRRGRAAGIAFDFVGLEDPNAASVEELFGRIVTQDAAALPGVAAATIQPGADWDGVTAGTGFATAPSDPTRTTAKPAARWLTPPSLFIVDQEFVGLTAFANNQGSLIGGVGRVVYNMEGTEVEVRDPTMRRLTRQDGTEYDCLGYWIKPTRPAGSTGPAQIYATIHPGDTTMQARVIGPQLHHFVSQKHDAQITVSPGQPAVAGENYHTINAALQYVADQQLDNPLITIPQPHTEDPSLINVTGSAYLPKGYVHVRGVPGVELTRASYGGDLTFRPRINRLHLENIDLDFQHIQELFYETTLNEGDHWLERCKLFNKGGRGARWRGGGRRIGWLVRGRPFFTECHFQGTHDSANGAGLVRGCTGLELGRDFAADAYGVVHTEIHDHDSTIEWLRDLNAYTVRYTGAEATATHETLSTSGSGSDAAAKDIILRAGSNQYTFRVGDTLSLYEQSIASGYDAVTAGQGYWVRDVVAWINAQPGFSAVLQNDTDRAASLSLPDEKGLNAGQASCKDTDLQVVTCFDHHSDFFQHRFGGNEENIVFFANKGTRMVGQNLFVSSTSPARDFLFVAQAFENRVLSGGYGANANSKLSRSAHSHVVMAHISMPTQRLELNQQAGWSADAYCLVGNIAVEGMDERGDSVTALTIVNCAVNAGETMPAHATGSIIAGSASSKFANAPAGDFSAAGELLSNPRAPVTIIDLKGRFFGTNEPVGAVSLGTASSPEVSTPTPSPTPSPPSPPPPPPPPPAGSLIDTDDLTATGNSARVEIIDIDSIRACYPGSGQISRLDAPIANGSYRIRGTLAAYDGAVSGITGLSMRIADGNSVLQTLTTAGAIDVTVTIATGELRFWADGAIDNSGFRFDDLLVEAAA